MNDIFTMLRDRLLAARGAAPDGEFRIRGVWRVDLVFQPNPVERVFCYQFLIVQTVGQGSCYCTGDDVCDQAFIGMDARVLIQHKSCFSIAALDSLYAALPRRPDAVHVLEGTSIEKTGQRTAVILDEADRLLAGVTGRAPVVVNVGVVGNVVRALVERGCVVRATDLAPSIVGTEIGGIRVENGARTVEYLRDADLAIVTGMTITTNTLEEIVSAAQQYHCRLLVFAETGAFFGLEYCRQFGIDTVVAEPFPFYIFQGTSRIEVYRRA